MISGTALITGADGFVGPYLSTQLRLDGWVVKGIDITDDKRRGCSVIDRCDIRDEEMLVSIIERDEPDRIFHLASLSHIPRSWESPKLVCDINLMGLINLMESLRNAHSKSCALIVGSAMEYGASLRDGTPVSEDAPLRPENPFATSKAAQDLIASQYCQEHGINVVRVRPFMHTGPWQQDMFLVPYLCRQVARIRMGLVRELVAPPEEC
ncbi:MAG: GDP-mannose 4,6-dehydratase [Planctomycetota bacterium]|nr:GDP-mannose 4,6-dehydratase [Planctomycetota bacterium]